MKVKFYKWARDLMYKFVLWYMDLPWVAKRLQKECDEEMAQFVINALNKKETES